MNKRKILQVGPWLWQAWPVCITLGLILANICAYRYFHYNWDSVHRVGGAFMQMAGGAFVLFSLNKNMGLFKQGTLGKRISRWWSLRPFRKTKNATLRVEGASLVSGAGSITSLGQVQKARTIEERVDELENRLNAFRQEAKTRDEELHKKIESIRQAMMSDRSEILKKVTELESLIATTVVGEANSQFFGILLVFYGTLLPVI